MNTEVQFVSGPFRVGRSQDYHPTRILNLQSTKETHMKKCMCGVAFVMAFAVIGVGMSSTAKAATSTFPAPKNSSPVGSSPLQPLSDVARAGVGVAGRAIGTDMCGPNCAKVMSGVATGAYDAAQKFTGFASPKLQQFGQSLRGPSPACVYSGGPKTANSTPQTAFSTCR